MLSPSERRCRPSSSFDEKKRDLRSSCMNETQKNRKARKRERERRKVNLLFLGSFKRLCHPSFIIIIRLSFQHRLNKTDEEKESDLKISSASFSPSLSLSLSLLRHSLTTRKRKSFSLFSPLSRQKIWRTPYQRRHFLIDVEDHISVLKCMKSHLNIIRMIKRDRLSWAIHTFVASRFFFFSFQKTSSDWRNKDFLFSPLLPSLTIETRSH